MHDDDPGVEAAHQRLLAAARANEEGGSRPRKHHLVPRSYLKRWEDGQQLRVTEVDSRKSFLTSAAKAARETDYYRIEHEDIDPAEVPPLLAETLYSRIEEGASDAITDILESGDRYPQPKAGADLARFMGMQLTRGQSFRAMHREMANRMFMLEHQDVTEAGLREHMERQRAGEQVSNEDVRRAMEFLEQQRTGELVVAYPDASAIGLALEAGESIGAHLIRRTWMVYETPRCLVTSDEPVVLVGGPGLSRGERAGVDAAAVILFPLSPDRLLTLVRQDLGGDEREVLDHIEVADVNREVIANATRWAFERPSRRATLGLQVPPASPPFAIEGPLPLIGPERGDRYRTFRPTRWVGDQSAPWPVERWWRRDCTVPRFGRIARRIRDLDHERAMESARETAEMVESRPSR